MMTDTNQSAPELAAVEIESMDRSAFLLRGALAAGAVYGAASVGPLVRSAFATGRKNDAEILNFALTLEYLEAAFYQQAADQVGGLSREIAGYVRTFGDEEQEHVDALAATISDLGEKPVTAPQVDFGDAFSSQDAFLRLAITLEDTGVSAYNGAAPMIKSNKLLATAGGIVQVEARHAAVIRSVAGENPAPAAFDPTLTTDEVLAAVQPFFTS
jgi:rubrerythrin